MPTTNADVPILWREGIGCISGVPSVQCLRDRRANRARSFSQRIVCQVRITGCRLRLSVAEQFADDRKAQGRCLPLCSHRLRRRSWSRTSRGGAQPSARPPAPRSGSNKTSLLAPDKNKLVSVWTWQFFEDLYSRRAQMEQLCARFWLF
jgi:hypothetical protein